MATTNNHIIKHLAVDFHFNKNENGFALQNEAKDWVNNFLSLLENRLTATAATERVIVIDELLLELNIAGSNWQQQASYEGIKQFDDKMQLIRTGAIQTEGIEEKSPQQHYGDTLLHYLQYGYLPWQAAHLASTEWWQQIKVLLHEPDKKFINRLKTLLSQSEPAQERFIRIIPFHSGATMLLQAGKKRNADEHPLINDLQLLMDESTFKDDMVLSQTIYKSFLQIFFDGYDKKLERQLTHTIKSTVNKNSIKGHKFQSDFFKKLQDELISQSPIIAKNYSQPNQQKQKFAQQKKTVESNKEEIFISNAGLVLVASFLPALFQKTGLSKDNTITSIDTAVCFINYLATGNKKMEEYELALPKILCGIETEMFVDTTAFYVNEIMEEEATNLLSSIIEHWNILKNTSADGLRESFLKRNGKLSFNGREWLLQVEQQSYDMLLERLPWNISMFKLPWMTNPLKTEWIH